KQLRNDQISDLIVNRRAEKNNIVFEESRINVKRALATRRLLDDHWNKSHIKENDERRMMNDEFVAIQRSAFLLHRQYFLLSTLRRSRAHFPPENRALCDCATCQRCYVRHLALSRYHAPGPAIASWHLRFGLSRRGFLLCAVR